MRIVVITAHSANGETQHRYVAGRLLAAFDEEIVAIVVATGRHKPLIGKVRGWLKRYSAAQFVSRIGVQARRKLNGFKASQQRAYRSVLFPQGENIEMPGGERVIRVALHNSQDCRDLLTRLRPDILVVYGTLIIGRKLIEAVPRIVNLHTGLSPAYRGSDTIFWPLHDGKPECVGVTVHRLDTGIDSGAILARGRPELAPGDTEHVIFAKAVKIGAELLCRAVRRELDGVAHPLAQQLDAGLEYRSADRTVAAERRVKQRMKSGLLAAGVEAWQEEF